MPDHFSLRQIEARSIVQLRVRPAGSNAACEILDLPAHSLSCQGDNPAAHWLGPDTWLLTSDSNSPTAIIEHIDEMLSDQLHAATNLSANYACFH